MRRHGMSRSRSKRVFRGNAKGAHRKNFIQGSPMRGGIRL